MPPGIESRVSNEEGKAGARDYREATSEQIDQEVRKLQDDACQLARTTLMADRDKLDVIAKALREYESLDVSQIEEIVGHGA
jgi:cell division protease FtsH